MNFATVFFSRKDRDELRKIVSARGWRQPVATDDGAIVNIYGVGGCPTTVFAKAGGKVRGHQARQPHRGPAAPAGRAAGGLMQLALSDGWVEPELAEELPASASCSRPWR